MTALANSLKRIWSAKNRVPRLTGWGTFGSCCRSCQETGFTHRAHERLHALKEIVQRNLPTVVALACSLFR
jgi:hypothetical protein